MKQDYHVHTYYSDDSWYEMEECIKHAIELGITDLCFTDHVDYGIKIDPEYLTPEEVKFGQIVALAKMPTDPEELKVYYKNRTGHLLNVNYPKYVEEISNLKMKYQDKINIKLGLEFGMQRHTIDDFEKLFARYPFDFILLSVHQVDNKEFWTNEYQEGKTQDEYILGYYEEMLYLVEHYKNYSCLAHIDMINRYDPLGPYPFEKLKPILTKILTQVIKDGKGIEINTSCYRYGLPDLTPSRDILKLYHELGGTIITMGSDSHKECHLGDHLDEVKDIIKKLGFNSICTFDHMVPISHKL